MACTPCAACVCCDYPDREDPGPICAAWPELGTITLDSLRGTGWLVSCPACGARMPWTVQKQGCEVRCTWCGEIFNVRRR